MARTLLSVEDVMSAVDDYADAKAEVTGLNYYSGYPLPTDAEFAAAEAEVIRTRQVVESIITSLWR